MIRFICPGSVTSDISDSSLRPLLPPTTVILRAIPLYSGSFLGQHSGQTKAVRKIWHLLSKELLPTWYQVKAVHRLMHGRAAKCLLSKHKTVMIANLMKPLSRTQPVGFNLRLKDVHKESGHQRTSKGQYTKWTEDYARVAWQDAFGGFSKAARILQSRCDFQVTGPSTDGVAIEDVIKMVEGFKKAPLSGRKEIAFLRHYSSTNLLPKSAPVAPRIFDELYKLDIMAWELEQSRFHPACNWHTKQAIEEALGTFTKRRSSFVDDDASPSCTKHFPGCQGTSR
ncbi:hypothetical protein BJV74DRAFT_990569 [Russula compacta]|nr:hypothetical protein BJV74DRAFT_990569 [Russula compacta]